VAVEIEGLTRRLASVWGDADDQGNRGREPVMGLTVTYGRGFHGELLNAGEGDSEVGTRRRCWSGRRVVEEVAVGVGVAVLVEVAVAVGVAVEVGVASMLLLVSLYASRWARRCLESSSQWSDRRCLRRGPLSVGWTVAEELQ